MKAVTIERFGGPEVLQVVERAEPRPGPGEIRVRVAAATVNPTDLALRGGGSRNSLPPPYVPGMELAGVVDALGEGVVDRRVGDSVMAIVLPMRPEGGAQAELVVVPNDSAAAVPDGMSLVEAATLPMNGLTARRALDLLALAPGATLAVTGAAGAVGGYVMQLGRAEGLRIVAEASGPDEALVRGLGADLVVPRTDEVGQAIRRAVPGGVDALVDAAVEGPAVVPGVRDGGRIASLRGWAGAVERGIVVEPVSVVEYAHSRRALETLAGQAAAGVLSLRVAATFPPEQVGEAHRRLAAGGVRGRLVIVF